MSSLTSQGGVVYGDDGYALFEVHDDVEVKSVMSIVTSITLATASDTIGENAQPTTMADEFRQRK